MTSRAPREDPGNSGLQRIVVNQIPNLKIVCSVQNQVCTVCTLEETDTPAVMYKSLNVVARDDFWVRPMDNFLERYSAVDLGSVEIAEFLKHKHQEQQ